MDDDRLCNSLIREAVKDPVIAALIKNIGSSPWKGVSIMCRKCNDHGVEGGARAFLQAEGDITLCTNRLRGLTDINEVLRHELTHAFDMSRERYDLYTCKGLAASEIRAARAAECNGKYTFDAMRDMCIKHHAERSTSNLFPQKAKECVKSVFEKAMKDLEPRL
jgi:hypothetical protein